MLTTIENLTRSVDEKGKPGIWIASEIQPSARMLLTQPAGLVEPPRLTKQASVGLPRVFRTSRRSRGSAADSIIKISPVRGKIRRSRYRHPDYNNSTQCERCGCQRTRQESCRLFPPQTDAKLAARRPQMPCKDSSTLEAPVLMQHRICSLQIRLLN